jgi:hypothetical protein
MHRVRGLIRLAMVLPTIGLLVVPSQSVFADTGDTAGLTSLDNVAHEMTTWNATQLGLYNAKLQRLGVVAAWSEGVLPLPATAGTSSTTVQNCGNDQCPPPAVTIQEDAAIQNTSYWCGPTSSHNVLYTFYYNGWSSGGTAATPSQSQLAGDEGTTGKGTDRGNIPPALNRYQSITTYSLGDLASGTDAWDYAVADLWAGYGSVWNIESYDHVTGQHPLFWYPNVDIMHYFASYAYKTSDHNIYVFDENNALSNHFYGVDPTSLYNASLANNRQNGVQPQVIW